MRRFRYGFPGPRTSRNEWVEFGTGLFLLLTVAKAIYPQSRIPARHYDMFAYEVGRSRPRTVMVFHGIGDEPVVISPANLLPFEAARSTSIVRTAAAMGEVAVRELTLAAIRAQQRGWRGFDQIWGPTDIPLRMANEVCVHIVDQADFDTVAAIRHERCTVTLARSR